MLLLIQPEYPPAVGGMQTHAAALASRLHAHGHCIAVATYAQPEDPHSGTAAMVYDAAQPFRTFRCLSRLSYWENLRRLRELVGELRPELIYSSTPFYGLLGELTGLPVVCRSVGTDVMRCWVPYPFEWGSGIVAHPLVESQLEQLYRRLHAPAWVEDIFYEARRRLVQRGAQTSSAIVANSSYTRDRLLEIGVDPSRVHVVAGGVDAARFASNGRLRTHALPGLRGSGPTALTVCRLVGKKGIEVLLQAIAVAREQLPDLTLVVVGDGPDRERYRRFARQLGLDGAVSFVGKVPHEGVVDYYHSTDIFVLASRVHRRRKRWCDVETMGRVICEANAAGLPVVATETGGVPSLVTHEENGLLVPPDDPDALASAMVRLWRSPDLRARVRDRGLRRARQEFDWEVVVRAYEELFQRAGEVTPRDTGRVALVPKPAVSGARL